MYNHLEIEIYILKLLLMIDNYIFLNFRLEHGGHGLERGIKMTQQTVNYTFPNNDGLAY